MLSRTAEHLYWMSRYMERAENMARLLDVANRLSMSGSDADFAWQPVLTISGSGRDYHELHGDISPIKVIPWAVLETANPSSIHASLRAARENAHAVRSTISNELWEAINATWLEMRELNGARLREQGLTGFCDWVKGRSHLFRGITYGTMLRDQAYHFLRLGTFLERGDNTARLINTRAQGVTAASHEADPSEHLHWATLLRAVSAFKAYRTLFKGDVTPARAAEMLILIADMPRSLHACLDMVVEILQQLRPDSECTRLAGAIHAELHWGRLDQLLSNGLDAFADRFIASNSVLGDQIHADFMMAA